MSQSILTKTKPSRLYYYYKKKTAWCGHMIRQGGLQSAIIDGLPAGTRRGRGRPKLRWVKNVTDWSGKSVPELRQAAVAREQLTRAVPTVPLNRYNLRERRPRSNDYAE